MSRRSVPNIQPVDLRDVATEERVERIWGRLSQDLSALRQEPQPRASRAVAWAMAATFAAFGVGLFAGRVVWKEEPVTSSTVAPARDRATVDVFAAGTQERTYDLPGGGSITLQPGSMIELEHSGGSDLRLRLLAGQASLDTAQAEQGRLAIVSGEATIATAPGSSVQVQKRDDNLDVHVASGSAQVSSPAGTRALRRGEKLDGVPTRVKHATASPTAVPVAPVRTVARATTEEAPAVQVAVAPSWREHHAAGKWDDAVAALKQQPGGIAGAIDGAKGASELMAISDVAQWRGGDAGQGIRALQLVADRYPSTAEAQIAALKLGKHYESSQPELAKKYLAQAAEKGILGEDAICAQMRAADRAGNNNEAATHATEYLGKYPNGRCKDDANRILSPGDAEGEGDPSDPAEAPSADPAPTTTTSATSSAP